MNQVDIAELKALCAVDMDLYNGTFFPKTFRQKSPPFHKRVYEMLNGPARQVAVQIYRGGSKTTMLQSFASHRIAYGKSNTILFISNAEDQSVASIQWIKNKVIHDKVWPLVYGLSRGSKWSDSRTEIKRANGTVVTLVPKGITGQVRGIKIEDYRPDLIVVDDVDNEETTATETQRQKQSDLLFGAILKSLAAEGDVPNAKMVVLGTPINKGDQISTCLQDRTFESTRVGCFDDSGKSVWPEMKTTETLLTDKQAHADRGQMSLWMREMECRIISRETSAFREEWLKYWDIHPPREEMAVFMAIDPVPPPSEREVAGGLRHKNYECFTVIGVHGPDVYRLDASKMRGHEPDWTISEFFRLVQKWNPISVRVESVNYQRTLKWLLEKEMAKRRRYVHINSEPDNRKKYHKIVDGLTGLASSGHFYVGRDMVDFVANFTSYPDVEFDDDLDSTAMAVTEGLGFAQEAVMAKEDEDYEYNFVGSAP